MAPLDARALPGLAGRVAVPQYDRGAVRTGVVHIGVGGFHRAHQAMYHDRLLEDGDALPWGICGVGLLPGDRRMQEALAAQDGLYTLVMKHPDGRYEPRVIGSIIEYLFAPDDPEAVVEKLALETTRVVSLTITEGGYAVDDVTGRFDATRPEVARDLEPGAVPATAFGLVTEALARRRARGIDPFTVMSCDNLEGNGDMARIAFSSFARLRDQELGDWISETTRFPNSVVDRITPATTDADREELLERTGIDDRWPVVCEPFAQWVLEDRSGWSRPPYERAGVIVEADVLPYELAKLRLLNAGHQAIAHFGRLCGHRLVQEAMADRLIGGFLAGYLAEEATPTLAPLPGGRLEAFRDAIPERFSNPNVGDTLERLAAEASDRIPKFLLPVIREQLAAGGAMDRAAAVVAAWARSFTGEDDAGAPIRLSDARYDELRDRAAREREDPLAFIAYDPVFHGLADAERFADAYRAARSSLEERGARATLETFS